MAVIEGGVMQSSGDVMQGSSRGSGHNDVRFPKSLAGITTKLPGNLPGNENTLYFTSPPKSFDSYL